MSAHFSNRPPEINDEYNAELARWVRRGIDASWLRVRLMELADWWLNRTDGPNATFKYERASMCIEVADNLEELILMNEWLRSPTGFQSLLPENDDFHGWWDVFRGFINRNRTEGHL